MQLIHYTARHQLEAVWGPRQGRKRKQHISIKLKLKSLLRAVFLAGGWDDPAQVWLCPDQ